MTIDQELLHSLFEQAKVNPRLRTNLDLRTSIEDGSQRMLNAMLPRTEVPIHRHEDTSESVICLCGKLYEVIYEESTEYVTDTHSLTEDVAKKSIFKEVDRILLCPAEGKHGCQIPKGAWHTIEVLEPSVIFDAKDGTYVVK